MNKTVKKFTCTLLSLLLAISVFIPVSSQEITPESLHVVNNSVNITVDMEKIARIGDTYELSNGTAVPFSILYEGTTYLPVRKLSEIFGIGIGYDADTRTVLIDTKAENTDTNPADGIIKAETRESTEQDISAVTNSVNISIDGKNTAKQGESYTLENGTTVPFSILYEGTTYLPVRKLSELLRAGVLYQDRTRTVFLTSPGDCAIPNTYYRLTEDKELNMLFIGGSVTEGNGASSKATSFPSVVAKKLGEDYSDAKINLYNLAIGGTTSEFAVYRYMREMAPKKPDILFIEYCINDYYTGLSYDRVVQTSESIVRIARRENPYIDIVYVFTFDKNVAETDYTQLKAHKAVAEHYGLPYVKLADSFYPTYKNSFGEYFKDSVHANDKGYALFADAIYKTLDKEFSYAKLAENISYTKYTLPEKTLSEKLLDGANMVFSDEILGNSADISGWAHKNSNFSWVGDRYNGILFANTEGSTFTYEFEGAEIGIAFARGPAMGNVICTVDDKAPVTVNGYLSYGNPKIAIIASGLSEGKHTIKIELRGKDDRSTGLDFQIAGFLIS